MDEIAVVFRIRRPTKGKIEIREVTEEEDLLSSSSPVDKHLEKVSFCTASRSSNLVKTYEWEEKASEVPVEQKNEGNSDDSSEDEFEEVSVSDEGEGEPNENEDDKNDRQRDDPNDDCDSLESDVMEGVVEEADSQDETEEDNIEVVEEELEPEEENVTTIEAVMHSNEHKRGKEDRCQRIVSRRMSLLQDIPEEEEEEDVSSDECSDEESEDEVSSSDQEENAKESDENNNVCLSLEPGTTTDSQSQMGHEIQGQQLRLEEEEKNEFEDGETNEKLAEKTLSLPNVNASPESDSRMIMFDHEIVKFVIRKSRKTVKITEIVDATSVEGSDGVEMEERESIATPDSNPAQDDVPVFTFKLRRSRTEIAFEESGFDVDEDDEMCSTDDASSCSEGHEHAFAASSEEDQEERDDDVNIDEEEDEDAFNARKRVKRADSFQGNESILGKVLQLLPFVERVKCESVSKTWYSAVSEVNRNHQSTLGVIGIRARNERLQNFCPLKHHFVTQADCVLLTDSFAIESVLRKVPNLQSLHIRCDGTGNVFHDAETAARVGTLCPRLEHISLVDDISGSDLYDFMPSVIENCESLRHIQLRFPCKSSAMVRENALIRKCLKEFKDQLEILSLNVPLHEDTCAYIANFCRLRKLSLHGTTIPMPGLVYLLERGNIRGKYIKCFSIVIDSKEQLQIISKNMVCLHTFHCVFSQFATQTLQPKDVQAIGKLKNLRTLFLSIWTNQLIDEGLIGIALGCRQLSSLTVNAEVSDQSVKYLGSFCPLIERLELNTTIPDLITDASIDSLIELKHLRFLTLYYCDISDGGIHKLLTGTKGLELLCISFSRRITCKTVDIVSRFAEEKPWERVTLILPHFLSKVCCSAAHRHDIPRNMHLSFN